MICLVLIRFLHNGKAWKTVQSSPNHCSSKLKNRLRRNTPTTKLLHAWSQYLWGLVVGQDPMAAPAKLDTVILVNILHKLYSFCFKRKQKIAVCVTDLYSWETCVVYLYGNGLFQTNPLWQGFSLLFKQNGNSKLPPSFFFLLGGGWGLFCFVFLRRRKI